MFASRKWTRIALALNLLGTVLLFYSFQATSSDFRLIAHHYANPTGNSAEYSLCVKDHTLLGVMVDGRAYFGDTSCPATADDRPAAVVNVEHPSFITIGFILIVTGFVIQYFAVPEQKSISELRKEIKMLKMKEKAHLED